MDTTSLIIIGSAVVIIIVITLGVKQILDLVGKVKEAQSQNIEAIKSETNEVVDNLKNEVKELEQTFSQTIKNQFSNLEQDISSYRKDVLNSISNTQESLEKLILEENLIVDNKTNSIKSLVESLNEILINSIEESNESMQNKLSKIENNYTSVVSLVNNLRIDNLINLINGIGEYKEGIYEDEHFLQEVEHCRIIKLTDKSTKEVTHVYYGENGEKSYTETFLNNRLKYIMKYEKGKLKTGFELNDDSETLFEYSYDDAEEISKKIEYIYDANSKLKDKIETNY